MAVQTFRVLLIVRRKAISAKAKSHLSAHRSLVYTHLKEQKKQEAEKKALEKEKRLQQAMLAIKKRHGKNAILHGTSYEEGATGRDRNKQIGGHKA